MNKAYSNYTPTLIEYIGRGFWRVRWAVESTVEQLNDETRETFEYMEEEFTHKPSFEEVKELILNWYNSTIDNKILSGFTWNNIPVWLSTENQFNYKAAFDLAAQTGGQNLPITFKLGTTEEPVYYTFSTFEELQNFYVASVSYIQNTLAEGWKAKDSINWEAYK